MTRGGKRKGAGRKSTGATDHLHIRISPERLRAYQEAAERAEMTLSAWVQGALDAVIGRK